MAPVNRTLTGRRALITGAGSATGIGFAAARALHELGASVILVATSDRIHERAAELQGVGIVADLTDEGEVSGLPDEVDVLVNNAGMTSLGGPAESGSLSAMSLATWRAGLARNLDTAFLVSRHVAGHMRAQRWGRIVNVASVTGPVMAMADEPAYAAAKSGMVGLTRSLALDLAPYGVTVNAVAPGWITTGSQSEDEFRQGLATPLGRSGSPGEVGEVVSWFCLPGASYVTGQCLVVDGANSIAEQRGPR